MTSAKYTITFLDRPDSKGRYRAALKMMGAESVRIEEKEAEPAEPKPKKDNVPTTDEAKAIADLFSRKHAAEWDDREIAAFKKARKLLTMDNIKLLTVYYASERRKGDEGIHRRDLGTFLAHVAGEIDRARAAKPANGHSLEWLDSRKVVAMPVPPEEAARIAAAAKVAAEAFRRTQRA